MIQTVVFIVIPLLLCCLSLALGIQCAFLGVSVLAVVLLLAAGALAGLSCFRGMGTLLYGSYKGDMDRSGKQMRMPITAEELATRKKQCAVLTVAAALCFAVALSWGGPVIAGLLRLILAL